MSEIITQMGGELLTLVLRIILAVVGVMLARAAKRYIDTDAKKTIVRDAVLFVEQVFKDLHGSDKLQQAMQVAEEVLAKYNIKMDRSELLLMIEAAVSQLNDSFHKEITKQEPQEPTEDAAPVVIAEPECNE